LTKQPVYASIAAIPAHRPTIPGWGDNQKAMDSTLKPLNNIKEGLEPGTIIRRIGNGKDQQGSFLEFDENYNMILANIIDLQTGHLVANEAVLKPRQNDKLYYYESSFDSSPVSDKAMKVITTWPLYKKHVELQEKIVNFISIAYTPEQVMEMSRTDTLHLLFIPVQQKFRIGRFNERRNMERVCNDVFMLWLESVSKDKHITYLARIVEQKHLTPLFYSAGTKTHEKTAAQLRSEIYKFDPTHGGHIKAAGLKKGKRHFIVDAGSKYMGLGTKTPLHVSEFVADALRETYLEFEFTPTEGQGALK